MIVKKAEFMESLAQRLAATSEAEREKVLDYYSEMIDDRVEEGMSEEDAVRALGDPANLAQAAAPDAVISAQAGKSCQSGMTFSESIRAVSIDCEDLSFRILPGALADGISARLDCPAGKAELLSYTLNDGVLEIRRLSPAKRLPLMIHFAPQKECVLTMGEAVLERLQMRSTLGDLDAQGLEIREALSLAAASGDILVSRAQILGAASLQSRSGDLTLREVSCEGALEAGTSSGDTTLEDVQAAQLEIRTASGDVEVRGAKVGRIACESTSGDQDLIRLESDGLLHLHTVSGDVDLGGSRVHSMELSASSGDIKLDQVEVQERVNVQLSSGDVILKHVSAAQFDISTSSGDVSGILSGGMDAYDFRAVTRCGDIRVPLTRGPRVVNVATSSGDVRLRAE